jgi:predicted nucleic acid-binding protein
MDRVFGDTGYWISLLNPRDELHEKATQVARDFGSDRIVTTEMVLTEFLNSFSEYGPHLRGAAAKAVVSLRASRLVIVPQTSRLFADALDRYRAMGDKSRSLTDCASFLIMEQEGFTEALTYDRHFVQAGYRALLRWPAARQDRIARLSTLTECYGL